MVTHESIRREQDNIRELANLAKGIDGKMYKGGVPSSITGKFIKHYSYDRFDEVSVETFANGAAFHEVGKGDEWFPRPNEKKAFEKARLRGARSRALNSMMG